MLFTVVWLPSAESDLARIWMTAPSQQAVTDAANAIDRLLRRIPLSVGEEYGDNRCFVVWPLEVVFSVSVDDCLVRVLEVSLLA